jgi:MYXO-CTERM domain-containing protein
MRTKLPLVFTLALLAACSGGAAPAPSLGERTAVALPLVQTPEEFVRRLPQTTAFASADGARLIHASGFSVDTGLARPVDAAAAFLAMNGAAFGVSDRHELAEKGGAPGDGPAAVHIGRYIDGLPVFGGDLVVGVANGRVFSVNSSDVPAAVGGSHALGPRAAADAALSGLHGGETATEPAIVAAGWRPILDQVRAVYQVDVSTRVPSGEWRLFVDGETGKVLFRLDRRAYASATGSVYEVSPVETAASLCPLNTGGTARTACAAPVSVTIPNLGSIASLNGSQTGVWNCAGADAPATLAAEPGTCTVVTSVSGGFSFAVDGTGVSPTDTFSAAMAYYHLDRHVTFFKKLDPTLPGGAQSPPSRAINGSLPGYVNVRTGGQPLDNAFFSGGLDAMEFGQGTTADFAYDATVMYHEFTHGVVYAWGGFDPNVDSKGGLDEPGGVNEGTADAMAAAETGRSAIGSFLGPSLGAGAVLRDMADPTASRTCKGNGTVGTQLGAAGVVNGLDGEVHDDGEIWNGFFWEVFQGLKSGGWKGCAGACDAGPAIQYKALQLAAGTNPTFASYAATMKTAADQLFPGDPKVGNYVQCVANRRGFDKCDRTVPLYAGEAKVQFVRLRYSPFQFTFTADTTATGSLNICSAKGTATTMHLRKGAPVALASLNPNTLDATITSDFNFTFSQPCSGGNYNVTFDAGDVGSWYVLLDSPSAFVSNNPGSDTYKLTLSPTGVATRPAATATATCTAPTFTGGGTALALSPSVATVAAGAARQFIASGGSGSGYVYSLQTNASGGSIGASSGLYTAGAAAGTDVVKVTDSAAATATATVTVTAGGGGGGGPVVVSPASPSVNTGGMVAFSASGGTGLAYTWSLQVNSSGGNIVAATGAYTAGANAGTDVVKVVDSGGGIGVANVTVAANGGGATGGRKSGGCATGGGSADALAALLVAAALFRLRRRSPRGAEVRS